MTPLRLRLDRALGPDYGAALRRARAQWAGACPACRGLDPGCEACAAREGRALERLLGDVVAVARDGGRV